MKISKYRLVLIILTSILFFAFSQNTVKGEWKIPSITDEGLNDFSTYENKFLKIDYPTGWKFTETNNNSVTFAPETNLLMK